MQGRILGHSDVVTDLRFVRVQTLSFEQRKSTKFRLNHGGALVISDVNSTESDCASVRREKNFTPKRNITETQSLLYRNNGSDSSVSVLGACWGTEELGWNERSRKKLRDVR